MPETGWPIKNSNTFPTVVKARSPRSGFPYGQVLLKALCQVADC